MYQISVSSRFSAAHLLRGYEGDCSNLHGHTWKYTIVIEGLMLDELGMLIDFKELKLIMKNCVEQWYDHKCLNDCPEFRNLNPTAENIARIIFYMVSNLLNTYKDQRYHVVEVSVNESEECRSTYRP
jgi:6-pyruvoyltetrahydropterin/6-carboxytetrahydropterin synthase